jgi:hypothetical protein
MVLLDDFKVMDISDNFFDGKDVDGVTHSDFCWWNFKDAMSEKETYMTIVMSKLGLLTTDYTGIEYWWSVRRAGDGLKIHQDKDEVLFDEGNGPMVHPVMSIITYPKDSFIEGGDHFFVDEKFGTKSMDWANFTESVYQRIAYKHNRLVIVSPGNLYHGVFPIERGERFAFVMNLWDRELA